MLLGKLMTWNTGLHKTESVIVVVVVQGSQKGSDDVLRNGCLRRDHMRRRRSRTDDWKFHGRRGQDRARHRVTVPVEGACRVAGVVEW